MNGDTSAALDYMEAQEGEDIVEPEKIDNSWLRRTALGFERKINKNRELRSKFEDDPMKFIESEGELDAEIKSWSILSEHPELYQEFTKLGTVNSLVQLLLHENTDIALNTIQILAELTDEDVPASEEQWNSLVEAMLEADILDLLRAILNNLDEDNLEDRQGVYYSLSLIENLVSNTKILSTIINSDSEDKLLSWLLVRAQKTEKALMQNTQYAAELLSIIASQSTRVTTDVAPARRRLIGMNAIDLFLQLLALYRKRDPPRDTDEEEHAENIFDALSCLVDVQEGKAKFVEAEGIELVLIMLREGGKFSKPRALRLLDHAASGSSGGSVNVCERLVDAAGLKPLFKLFMSLDERKEREMVEHVLSIVSSLLRYLPGDSAARIRMLAKWAEKGYEKVKRLCKLRQSLWARLEPITKQVEHERKEASKDESVDMEGVWLGRRLEAGLFSFQTTDVILAWLVAEDDAAMRSIEESLGKDAFMRIKDTLSEQIRGLDEEGSEDEKIAKDMLGTLIAFLN